MVRQSFSEQLAELQNMLLQMGEQVDTAIERALEALSSQDTDLAHQVIAGDEPINKAHRDIEERSLVLIATQQPTAGDLRTIIAISNIATELERIGDYAEGVARITLRIANQPLVKPLSDIPRMVQLDRELLKGQLEAFVQRDAARAEELAGRDDEVDAIYDQVYNELLFFMVSDPRTITRATHLLWVAHDLERIADRTTNIGERTVYLVTGEVKELNLKPQ